MAYIDLSKLNLAQPKVLKAFYVLTAMVTDVIK